MQPIEAFTLVTRCLAATACSGLAIVYAGHRAWPPAIAFGLVAAFVWYLAFRLFLSKVK